MQNANYPEYYEVFFQTGYHSNELTKNGVYITTRLVEAITKTVRPQYDSKNGIFYSVEDYRIRIEVTENSGRQYYVLDVGQNFKDIDVSEFRIRINVAPLYQLALQNATEVAHGDAGVGVGIVGDDGQSVVGERVGAR